MRKCRFSLLLLVLLYAHAAAIAFRDDMPTDPEYQNILAQRPLYVEIGVGDAAVIGPASRFKGTVTENSKAATSLTEFSMASEMDSKLNIGYRFTNWPLRIAVSRLDIYGSMNFADPAVVMNPSDIVETIYSVIGYFDFPMTEHWFASLGLAAGVIEVSANQVAGQYSMPSKDASGFAYQSIVEFSYRFSRFLIGVSYAFLGSTLAINKVYPTAATSRYIYNGSSYFELGFMF